MRLQRLIVVSAMLTAGVLPRFAAATQEPLRLPLTILRNSNPVASIEVAGHEIKVVVDTGGGVLALTRELLTQAGAVELAGNPTLWNDAHGQTHEARRFRVPQIRVGGRSFTNLNAMTLLSPETADTEAEALGCNGTRVPFERSSESGLAISQVELDGATIRLLWDTGATYSMLPAEVVTAHQLPVTPAVDRKPSFYNTKRLVIGGSNFGPLEFVVLPLQLPTDFEGMLGYNAFAKHVVCLNYGRGELRVR